MKHLFLSLLTCGSLLAVHAQTNLPQPGKTFKTVTDIKVTTNINFAGQDIETVTSGQTTTIDTIKNVSANGYTYSATITRVKGGVKVMGQDQNFDSDDSALRNNPEMADLFKALNVPNLIEVKDGKLFSQSQKVDAIIKMGGADDQAKYLFLLPANNLKEGFQWTDSTTSEADSKTVSQYTIKQITDNTIVLEVKANIVLKETMNRNGMDIVQNLKGTALATRTYNKASRLLMNETSNVDLGGTMEMMGQSAPVTSKGTITTTVTD